MNPIQQLTALGQSLWYDNIQRRLLESGALKSMIERGEIRGVTSNPTIFHNAIAKTHDYDPAILPLAWSGWRAEDIFWQLAIEDIRQACQLFQPLYEETQGEDGYVSLEVNPHLAHDTEGTISQAHLLWERVARPNLMIKVPATPEGIPAIRRLIAAGLNINVTLIFSLERYRQVMEAYLAGLEDRLNAGADHLPASVASFFVSRLDTKVDARLPAESPLRGKAAIANARLAYDLFRQTFQGERWQRLQAAGARPQRPLWASTSTKNPAYPDTLYVDNLIGPYTVNTVPPQTLDAFRHHGHAALTLTAGLEEARQTLAELESLGISLAQVTRELEDEGVQAFADAFDALLQTLEERRSAAASQTGPLAGAASKRVASLQAESFPARLWAHDPTLWTTDPLGQAEIRIRLGWLTLPETSRAAIPEIQAFVADLRRAGFRKALVLGMGGSSLTPEVLSLIFSPFAGEEALKVGILDSTDPLQVLDTARQFPPEETLYIVASKSGGTAEVTAAFNYFWALSAGDGSRFAAITDPATSLEVLARERNFRKIFLADPNVGGRYSALTHFGLVAAALLGIDLRRFLQRAAWLQAQSGPEVIAARNPGLVLGAILGEAALQGRDKLTILSDPLLAPFGSWIEQIIAESSGKQGRGIIPVDGEPLADPAAYGADRIFVYLKNSGELAEAAQALRRAGFPLLEFPIADPYDLAAEFYRWEVATAVACAVLGVNAFDQPDVQEAKERTKAGIAAYLRQGNLPERDLVEGEAAVPALEALLAQARPGDYFALNAYLPRTPQATAALTRLRQVVRARTACATTLGFGPRFQHSTGQLHKGGPNSGLFIQFVYDSAQNVEIPTQGLTFGVLQRAQALGDYEALRAVARRVVRVHLSADWLAEIQKLSDALVEDGRHPLFAA